MSFCPRRKTNTIVEKPIEIPEMIELKKKGKKGKVKESNGTRAIGLGFGRGRVGERERQIPWAVRKGKRKIFRLR